MRKLRPKVSNWRRGEGVLACDEPVTAATIDFISDGGSTSSCTPRRCSLLMKGAVLCLVLTRCLEWLSQPQHPATSRTLTLLLFDTLISHLDPILNRNRDSIPDLTLTLTLALTSPAS